MAIEEEDPETRLENFLKQDKYRRALSSLGVDAGKSVTVGFSELYGFDREIAARLVEKPREWLEILEHAAYNQLRIEDPEYSDQVEGVKVRVEDLFEETPLRQVSADHINQLVMVKGIVVKATVPRPKVLNAAFECGRCGNRQMVPQLKPKLETPMVCKNPKCKRRGPFRLVESESEYINIQHLWLQETPEELPPGQLPRTLHVKVLGELVDVARPGDNVCVTAVTGITRRRKNSSTFNIHLEANHIKVMEKEPQATPTESEIEKIQRLSEDPWIHRKIKDSIAPSIYGYEGIKEAIMYLLFGGVPKKLPDIKIRGNINLLVVGDPGTAKSQLLRYVSNIAPRGIYTSGKGSSGVGLTAAVVKDKQSGEYSLQAGVLVLADRGVACIDEIDKMRDTDRSAIHEALEQHTVSVAKAGIVATLNARTSVLAAANPLHGRYNYYKPVAENLGKLTVTLLSRFDLIFISKDIPDQEKDSKLSEHMLNIHSGHQVEPPIPPDLLKKYVAYARNIKPEITAEAQERIQDFYMKMRKTSEKEGTPICIGPRQLESLTRLSEARARAALRDEVSVEDAQGAINIMMRSLREVGVDTATGELDVDIILTGKPQSLREKRSIILEVISELQMETDLVEKSYLINHLEEKYDMKPNTILRILNSLLREAELFSPREGYLKRV